MPIAFQGEPGAYGEQALRLLFGDAETSRFPSFGQVFEAVAQGRADAGVVPIENSYAGSITDNYDLLLKHQLNIVGQAQLHIQHCLLAVPGQTLDEIQTVYSHPQALMQCEAFIQEHSLRAVPEHNTAAAAKRIASERQLGVGAIASRTAAELYGLEILAENIQTNPSNFTRFVAVSREPAPRSDPSRTSLVLMMANVPGSLHRALGALASRGLNMTKLESRPSRKVAWEYVFYLDFDGHIDDAVVQEALDELGSCTSFARVLGSYPKSPPKAHPGQL